MLKVTDLHVSYGQVAAVKGVSLNVEDGELIALVGANGAGKSTTLKAISLIEKPKNGSIRYNENEF